MFKNISDLGKRLTKNQQQKITGGFIPCNNRRDCFIATGEMDWYCNVNSFPKQCQPY